jgi:hypothetical protein
MNTTQISVPQGDCILSVSHSKRTVSLIRSGNRGTTLYDKTGNGRKISWPENDRGWSKVEKTSITTMRINPKRLELKPSISTLRELNMPKKMDFNQLVIAAIHDIAYECARNGGSHCIAWKLQSIATGDSITAVSKWENGKIAFTFKFEYCHGK